MEERLLQTKINIPPATQDLTVQEQLILAGPEAGTPQQWLTLVAAPAGFGKTTFARHWISPAEPRSAWYALDAGDNDRERFWTYLIAALQKVEAPLGRGTLGMIKGSGLLAGEGVKADAFLIPLLNDLFSLAEPVVLVLDDYHVIENAQIHADMMFFLENASGGVHLVVTTRSEPPWPLARWRARGHVREVRQQQLTFSLANTKEFLQRRLPHQPLTSAQIQMIHEKTAGWVTGLQLMALSLNQQTDIESYLQTFAGSHRHVLHFLTDEVLRGVPERLQAFLQATSLLERFCPELCQAVTGFEDSAELLWELEAKNMFVIPLDNQHGWYRYHPLFADLLREQFHRKNPEDSGSVHRRAAAWYEQAGEPGEALRHALRACDHHNVLRVLDGHLQRILATEGPDIVVQSLEELPGDAFGQLPELAIQRAWFHLVHRGKEQGWQRIQEAQAAVQQHTGATPHLQGMLAVVTAYYSIYAQQFGDALEQADMALTLLPVHDHYWRSKVAIIAGDARLFTGRPQKAYERYLQAYNLNRTYGYPYLILSSGFKVASSLLFAGRLVESETLVRELLDLAQTEGFERVPRIGLLWTLLGELLREKGELTEAVHCIERGLHISSPEKPSLGWNYLFRVNAAYSCGQYQEAEDALAALERLHQEVELPRFILVPLMTWRARLHLRAGRLPEAEREAVALVGQDWQVPNPGLERATLIRVHWCLRQGGEIPAEAVALVEEMRRQAAEEEHTPLLLEVLWLQVLLAEVSGEQKTADARLLAGLEIGWKHRYYQSIVDEAGPIAAVYQRLREQRGQLLVDASPDFGDYVQNVLTGVLGSDSDQDRDPGCGSAPQNAEVSVAHGRSGSGGHHEELLDDLTERELEILGLLAAGMSNAQIAAKLFISPGTVKWHTSNLYGKMGVGSRTHAVALARRLQLLP